MKAITETNSAEGLSGSALLSSSADRPIKSCDDDDLDRLGFVKRLCKSLVNRKIKRATGIALGITAPWGSGKTSILNMLEEQLLDYEPDTIVVRFDPWIFSGRDDLINQFFRELQKSIIAKKSLEGVTQKLIENLSDYSFIISRAVDSVAPGVGIISENFLLALKKKNDERKSAESSIYALRETITGELQKNSIPIVVLIDELDRLTDDEIRSITQLVRSVLDFPNISYVVAYDSERVVQALGDGNAEYGRKYLEKIVQHQIPLPVMLPDELLKLLVSEIDKFSEEVGMPIYWDKEKRFKELANVIIPHLVSTPRDVKRLVGTFHVITELVESDVTWRDSLAFSVIQSKAEDVVSMIRGNPDHVVEDPLSPVEQISRYGSSDEDSERRLNILVNEKEHEKDKGPIKELLKLLFPVLNDEFGVDDRKVDDICFRRPLMTILRLGLLPSAYSRLDIINVLNMQTTSMCSHFNKVWEEERFPEFFSRLEDVYLEEDIDRPDIWYAASDFLRKKNLEWERHYSGKHETARAFALMFQRKYLRANSENTERAKDIFNVLLEKGDAALIAYLMRSHIFTYGLFGREQSERIIPFLSKSEAEKISVELAKQYKKSHLEGDFLLEMLDLNPYYLILDAGLWDRDCMERMQSLVDKGDAIDALALMFYGGAYNTDRETVDKFVGWTWYNNKVREILEGNSDGIHDMALAAMKKSLSD